MEYASIVARRRSLKIDGYRTLADVGFDGNWVTPYQISSRSEDGPVLVAMHWLDAPSIDLHRDTLQRIGYLPQIRFNKTLDIALDLARLTRADLYMTQAFQLVPTRRSEAIPRWAMDQSFDTVTLHELKGRRVIALGDQASILCTRHGVAHRHAPHPSRRGHSNADNAREIFAALAKNTMGR